jgi:site-specific recombinase XerD
MTALAATLQAFFTDRLARQRQVSPNTLAAYRDTLRLLLVFAADKKGKEPSKLDIDDLDAPLIGAFLDDLEHQRKNSTRTRNARLAAIRSLFRYAALRHPDHAALIERVLAIPPKRFNRGLVTFLTEPEISALLATPDRSTWTGRRDHTLFSLAAQTGLRASELIGLRCADVHLAAGAHVSCQGKGRKQRITPLTSGLVTTLRVWLAERAGLPGAALFVTRSGKALSRDALEHRLAKYVQMAGGVCPTLMQKSVTMHVLRHSAAMRLLRHRHLGDRALAWARERRDHPDLLACRSGDQGARLGQNDASRDSARPIPPHRQTSRLSGGALIMPLPSQRSPPPRPVWPRWSA